MRRITAFTISLFLALSAALGAYTEKFVTKGKLASDLNGGGPTMAADDGPDYTTVDASVIAGSLTTVVDNSGGNWKGVVVDHFITIDTGGLKENRRVSALAPGGDATKITIASAATACANKEVRVGGAWATIDFGVSSIVWQTAAWRNAAGAPAALNVQYSATAYNEYATVDNAGNDNYPAFIEGYETAAHDGCPTGNLPNIDGTGCTGTACLTSAVGMTFVSCFHLTTNVNGDHGLSLMGGYSRARRIRASATGTAAIGIRAGGVSTHLFDCVVDDSTSYGIELATDGSAVACETYSSGSYGIYMTGAGAHIAYCISAGAADDAIMVSGRSQVVLNCVGHGSTGGSGVKVVYGYLDVSIRNCIFSANNQYGMEVAIAATTEIENYNAFYNNTQGARSALFFAGPNDVTLTGDPFVAAGTNFALNATAGAGAACRNAGFPGALLDGVNLGYADIGALQHADPVGGSGIPSHLRGGHVQ